VTRLTSRSRRPTSKAIATRLTLYSLLLTPYALLLGCRSTPPPTPLDHLNAQQIRGHQVFQFRCGLCHYDRVAEPLHGPPLLGLFKKPYLPSGAPANDDRVTATILHGRNLMPAQPALDPTQSPGDLADLLTYLHTL
jgi:mono/diheme cytochrome c family protein